MNFTIQDILIVLDFSIFEIHIENTQSYYYQKEIILNSHLNGNSLLINSLHQK